MQRLNYYLAPFINGALSIEDFEKKVYAYCEILQLILEQRDSLRIPEEFYEIEFNNQVSLVNYLFTAEYSNDLQAYFLENIKELGVDSISYKEIIQVLEDATDDNYTSLTGLENQSPIRETMLYVSTKEELLNPARFYLSKSPNLEVFKKGFSKSFPNLYFHPRVETTITHFRDIQNHADELIRHLQVLNDFLPALYLEYHENHQEIYNRLKSEYNIYSSGLGSNEKAITFEIDFKDVCNNDIAIKCVPHTKLYSNYSNERIYFFWGSESIQNGKVLIGHVGKHWE